MSKRFFRQNTACMPSLLAATKVSTTDNLNFQAATGMKK